MMRASWRQKIIKGLIAQHILFKIEMKIGLLYNVLPVLEILAKPNESTSGVQMAIEDTKGLEVFKQGGFSSQPFPEKEGNAQAEDTAGYGSIYANQAPGHIPNEIQLLQDQLNVPISSTMVAQIERRASESAPSRAQTTLPPLGYRHKSPYEIYLPLDQLYVPIVTTTSHPETTPNLSQ